MVRRFVGWMTLALLALGAGSASAQWVGIHDPWRSEEGEPFWSYDCGGAGEPACALATTIQTRLQIPDDANAVYLTAASRTLTAFLNTDCVDVDDPRDCCTAEGTGTCTEAFACDVIPYADMPDPVTDPVAVASLLTVTQADDDTPATTLWAPILGSATNFDVPAGTTFKRWVLPRVISFGITCDDAPAVAQFDLYYMFGR